MNYRRLYARILDDPDYLALDLLAKVVLFHVIGRSNRIGLFKFSVAATAEDLNMPFDEVRQAFSRVLTTFEWRYDQPSKVLFIPTWWRWNEPSNLSHLVSLLKDLPDVPKTPLFEDFARSVTLLPEEMQPEFTAQLDGRTTIVWPGQQQQKKRRSGPNGPGGSTAAARPATPVATRVGTPVATRPPTPEPTTDPDPERSLGSNAVRTAQIGDHSAYVGNRDAAAPRAVDDARLLPGLTLAEPKNTAGTVLLRHYAAAWKEAYGLAPSFNWQRELGVASRLVTTYGLGAVQAGLTAYFQSGDYERERAHPFRLFASKAANWIAVAQGRGAPAVTRSDRRRAANEAAGEAFVNAITRGHR